MKSENFVKMIKIIVKDDMGKGVLSFDQNSHKAFVKRGEPYKRDVCLILRIL